MVPDGFRQTFPPPISGTDPQGGAHLVILESGDRVENINFGNQPIARGSVHGVKWLDLNGNGRRDDDEPGLAGVVIYSDLNHNGALDQHEPHTITLQDSPLTAVDETGLYWLEDLEFGQHLLREIVPAGFTQTFPGPNDGGAHKIFVGPGDTGHVNFGNQPNRPGQVYGLKWLDLNGNGQRDDNERGIAGVVIYSDLNKCSTSVRASLASSSLWQSTTKSSAYRTNW